MGVNITTIVYLRVLIIEIGSTIVLMVVEAQGLDVDILYHAIPSLKLTFSHLKMNAWNTRFLSGPGLFSGAKMLVSGRVISSTACDPSLGDIFLNTYDSW